MTQYILLLAAIGAELVGPYGGLQVCKCRVFGAPISISVPLSIQLLEAIETKLIGPHGGLQIGKCRAFGAPISISVPLSILLLARLRVSDLIN